MLSVLTGAGRDPVHRVLESLNTSTVNAFTTQWVVSVCLWGWPAGVGAVSLLPHLPQGATYWLLLVVSSTCCICGRWASSWGRWLLLPGVVGLGLGWGIWHAQGLMDARLPEVQHGSDFPLTVEVVSLPEVSPATFRFGRAEGEFGPAYDIRFTARVNAPAPAFLLDRTLSVRWYGVPEAQRHQLRNGSHWRMTLRLKTPRGSINPHTFDYEAWLLQRGIAATGYVRSRDGVPELVAEGRGFGYFREVLRDGLSGQSREGEGQVITQAPLMAALLLGDRSDLEPETRELLRNTGTAHLLAISGLHVGMVAAIGLLLGRLISWLIGLYRPLSPGLLPAITALLCAGSYTLVAGAPLSAQRALIMTAVLLLAWLWRRRIGAGSGFALALAAVVTWQPLAPLNAGFWLSFGAVAGLLLGYSGRLRIPATENVDEKRFKFRIRDWLYNLTRSQWLIFVCLLVPSALIFSGVSFSGLLLNLMAIPWVGFLVLPVLLLVGVVLSLGYLFPGILNGSVLPVLLNYVDWQLSCLLDFLAAGEQLAPGWQPLTIVDPLLAGLALLAVLLLILPRGFPGRYLGYVLPVLFVFGWTARGEPGLPVSVPDGDGESLSVTVLDVGQGLAIAVRSGGTSLVFDTGIDSPSGWSAGDSIVAPYLRGEGVRRVDALILSHGDRDHAGGLAGLLAVMPVDRGFAPGQLKARFSEAAIPTEPCIAGTSVVLGKQAGAFKLDWLWPESTALTGEENAHSCVALLQWRGHRILLTGDIPASVERRLASQYPDFAAVDLLVAPHHGSRSSSSLALVQWARPGRVVFSAGFRHHFGHPHPDVVERFAAAGSQIFNTAEMGAVRFEWSGEAENAVIRLARCRNRFWYKNSALCEDWRM